MVTPEMVAELNARSFPWKMQQTTAGFPGYLAHLDEYIGENGHPRVPAKYVSPDGYKLGSQTSNMRSRASRGELPAEQLEALDARGFVWHASRGHFTKFPAFLAHLDEYIAAHGDACAPQSYVCPDGYRLGSRVIAVRSARRNRPALVTSEMIDELDARGFVWHIIDRLGFPAFIAHLDEYIAAHGNACAPQSYVCSDGYRLGQHVGTTRAAARRGKLSPGRVKELDTRGFAWRAPQQWADEKYFQEFAAHFRDYQAEQGNSLVPRPYVCADGYSLGRKFETMRLALEHARLSAEQTAELDALGFARQPRRRRRVTDDARSLVVEAMAQATHPFSSDELADLTGLSHSVIRNYLRQLEREGKAVRHRVEGQPRLHVWQAAPEVTGSAD